MTYAMVFASVATLLLAAPALAASPHSHSLATPAATSINQSSQASADQGGGGRDQASADRDRQEMAGLLDGQMKGILHNPHCDPDDQNGPDGDKDDHAANNPGRGKHLGRCIGRPASP